MDLLLAGMATSTQFIGESLEETTTPPSMTSRSSLRPLVLNPMPSPSPPVSPSSPKPPATSTSPPASRKWDPLPDPPPLEPPLLGHPPQLPKRSPRPPLRRKSLLISVMVSTCSEMKRNTERIGEQENARYPGIPCSSSIIVSKFVKNLNPNKKNLYY